MTLRPIAINMFTLDVSSASVKQVDLGLNGYELTLNLWKDMIDVFIQVGLKFPCLNVGVETRKNHLEKKLVSRSQKYTLSGSLFLVSLTVKFLILFSYFFLCFSIL